MTTHTASPLHPSLPLLVSVLGGRIEHTGGGCQAITVVLPTLRDAHVMLTDVDGGALPPTADGPFMIGLYTEEHPEGVILAEAAPKAQAVAIVSALLNTAGARIGS